MKTAISGSSATHGVYRTVAAALANLRAGPRHPRRHRGAALAALLALAACGRGPDRIVLVSIDTLRADFVGCYGAQRAHTPTLDGLAREGVRFEAAVAPTPITLPSHTSLLTGLDPPRHGVHHNGLFRLPDDVPTLAERMRAAGFATAAFVGAAVLDRRYGLARGFDHYDDQMGLRRTAAGGEAERTADRVVDAALAWLDEAPERFFLWVHLYDPHADYEPPPGFAASFPGLLYAGEIAFADFETGRLLTALRERYGDAGTLVVATSDHGESRGEHGELTHSLSIYDATQRVPLLMSGPGLPHGTVVKTPVRLADVTPTLLALAGLPPLAEASGSDLRPWIGGGREATPPAYVESLAPHLDFRWSPLYGLRTGRWKYIRAPRPELYDLASDPGETENRIEAHPDVARDLDAQLDGRLRGARPLKTELAPDAAERARLASLGYLPRAPDASLELGRVEGPDPKDEIRSVLAVHAAWAAISRGEPQQGLELLERWKRAGAFATPSPFVAWTFSEVALAAGESTAAERHAREALALQPGFAEALLVLGDALLAQGRLAEARQAYERAAEAVPGDAGPLVGLGRIAEAEGRLRQARDWYERARDARVPAPEALEQLQALDAAEARP